MNHDTIRELLALRLYGELDPLEEQALVEHLRDCSECTLFLRQLEDGLGRARALQARTVEADLPLGWDASLADTTAQLRRRSWTREALLVSSGLAAGVLLVLAWDALAGSSPRPQPPAVASADPDAPAFLRFQSDTPPPLATSGGPEARFLAWQAR